VLGYKSKVNTDKSGPEVGGTPTFIQSDSYEKGEPMVETSEKREDNAYAEDIMEMGYDIVGVVKDNVERRIRKHDASKTTKSEEEDKTFGPEKGNRGVLNRGTVKGG